MNYIDRLRKKLDAARKEKRERRNWRSRPQTNALCGHDAVPKLRWDLDLIDTLEPK